MDIKIFTAYFYIKINKFSVSETLFYDKGNKFGLARQLFYDKYQSEECALTEKIILLF